MTKRNDYKVPSGRELMENIEYSPYYNVAIKMLQRKGVIPPYNIADILECFHEIAKVDHKINNRGEN